MIKLVSALLIAVACSTAALAADDSRNDLLKKIDNTITVTEKSRTEHCPVQTVASIRTACDRAYDMIVARERSYKVQLAFMFSVGDIPDHAQLKADLVQLRTVDSYNAEVRETSLWMVIVEKEFQADRQVAGR